MSLTQLRFKDGDGDETAGLTISNINIQVVSNGFFIKIEDGEDERMLVASTTNELLEVLGRELK